MNASISIKIQGCNLQTDGMRIPHINFRLKVHRNYPVPLPAAAQIKMKIRLADEESLRSPRDPVFTFTDTFT